MLASLFLLTLGKGSGGRLWEKALEEIVANLGQACLLRGLDSGWRLADEVLDEVVRVAVVIDDLVALGQGYGCLVSAR